jgi:hypothetical protein
VDEGYPFDLVYEPRIPFLNILKVGIIANGCILHWAILAL